MKRGYRAEYEAKQLLFKKYSPLQVFKIAVGGAMDFLVLSKNAKALKIIEVKNTNKKRWYPLPQEIKQYKRLCKIQKKLKIPIEYWIKTKKGFQIFSLKDVKKFF